MSVILDGGDSLLDFAARRIASKAEVSYFWSFMVLTINKNRPVRSYRQASPSPASTGPGARSARRLCLPHCTADRAREQTMNRLISTLSRYSRVVQRVLRQSAARASAGYTRRRPRLNLESLEERTVPSATLSVANASINRDRQRELLRGFRQRWAQSTERPRSGAGRQCIRRFDLGPTASSATRRRRAA